MLIGFEQDAVTTPDLSKQDSIFARFHLHMVSEDADLLVDGGCPCVLDGRVLDVSVDETQSRRQGYWL